MFFKYFFCSSSLFPVFLLRGTCRVNSPSCGIPSSRPQLQKKTQLNQSYHGRGMSPRHSTPLYLNTSTAPARARRTTRIFSGVPSYFEQFHSEVSPPSEPARPPWLASSPLRSAVMPLDSCLAKVSVSSLEGIERQRFSATGMRSVPPSKVAVSSLRP